MPPDAPVMSAVRRRGTPCGWLDWSVIERASVARCLDGCVRRSSTRSPLATNSCTPRSITQGVDDADAERECNVGGRTEGWTRQLQCGERKDQRRVLVRLALRERRRHEPRG